jgi:hypothetical protein
MNDVSAQIEVATVALAQRQEKLQGQQALKLIQGAGAQQQLSSPPPPPSQPVSVTPRAGSSIEVIA